MQERGHTNNWHSLEWQLYQFKHLPVQLLTLWISRFSKNYSNCNNQTHLRNAIFKSFHRWLLSTPHASFDVNPLAHIYMPSEVQSPSVTKALIQYFLNSTLQSQNESASCNLLFLLKQQQKLLPAHNYKSILTDTFLTDLQSSRRGHPCAHTSLTLQLCQEHQEEQGRGKGLPQTHTNNQLMHRWIPGFMTGYTQGSRSCTEQSALSVWVPLAWRSHHSRALEAQNSQALGGLGTDGEWGAAVGILALQPSLLRAQERLRGRRRAQVWGWHLWAQPCQVPPLLQRQNSAPSLLGKHWTAVVCQTQRTWTISMLTHET